MTTTQANWVQAERIHHELHATASTVRALRESDPEFQAALDIAIAALLRNPSGSISHVCRIHAIFSDAVGRRAEREYNERALA